MGRRYQHLAGPLAIQIICGLAYGLCFPPNRLRALAWIVLAPSFAAVRRLRVVEAAAMIAVLALVGALATADWLPRTIAASLAQPSAAAWGVFALITLVMVVPPYAVFGAFYRAVADRFTTTLPLVAASAWVAAELLRAAVLDVGHWGMLGYSQASVGPLIQACDLTGIYGVSFVVVAVNVGLAELWYRWRAQREWSNDLGWLLVAPALVVAAALGYGGVRLALAPPLPAATSHSRSVDDSLTVAVIQSNLDSSEGNGRALDLYLRLSVQALQELRPQLIVWPASSLGFLLERDASAQRAIAAILQQGAAQLIAGGPHVGSERPEKLYNSAFALAANGRIMARHDKQTLLPFAEYSPLEALGVLGRASAGIHDVSAGSAGPPLPAVGGSAGVLIGSEVIDPDLASERVQRGARYLINLADESDAKLSMLAFDVAAVRAVEQRRYLVRAATYGPSAIIDPFGRIDDLAKMFRREIVDGRIVPSDHLTVYAQIGDAFAQACAVLAFLSFAVSRFQPRVDLRL